MSNLGNKVVMAANLKKYLQRSGKSQKELCAILGFKETTFSDWMNAKSYPRIDKIEIMANYFGIQKSDLIEDSISEQPYYLNPETAALAQQIHDNPDLRILMDASKDLAPEDVKFVADLVSRMKKKESGFIE